MTSSIEKPLDNKTIFIMEDDQFISRVYMKWLKALGAKTLVANNGALGVERLQKESADLILLDLGMPGLNGYDTLINLKKNPLTSAIPIVIVTNTTVVEGSEQYKEIMNAGAAGILRKYETSLDELVKCVIEHLNPGRKSM